MTGFAASAGGRLLGLDVGSKRIGVALSDPLGFTAQGLQVLTRTHWKEDAAQLASLCTTYGVTRIVVGNPRRTDGSSGPEADHMDAFAQRLERATGVRVVLWDERFTTKAAQRTLIEAGVRRRRRREVIDMVAASLILQSYLDSQRMDADE